jgi:Ni,Fe-hydrogenase III large subunit
MDVVVGRDVLLDRLATIGVIQSVSCSGVEKSGPPIPSGVLATARWKTQETYLLPLRSLSYTQKDQSVIKYNK